MKYKSFTLINLLGLAIGITAFILLMQYVSFELSYDTFLENGKNINRVQANQYHQRKLESKNAFTPPALEPTLQKNIPGIKTDFRLTSWAENYTVLFENSLNRLSNSKGSSEKPG